MRGLLIRRCRGRHSRLEEKRIDCIHIFLFWYFFFYFSQIEEVSMVRIAIYSANFGRYRGEFATTKVDPYGRCGCLPSKEHCIDFFFFTDDPNVRLDHWNLIVMETLPSPVQGMSSFRHTAKYIKFVVPEILHSYDIVVWIDNKSLSTFLPLNVTKLISLVDSKNRHRLCIVRHPSRSSPLEELQVTLALGFELKANGERFKETLRSMVFRTCLPDSTCMFFEMNAVNVYRLQKVYEALIHHGLQRDQNILQYVWKMESMEEDIVYFISSDIRS